MSTAVAESTWAPFRIRAYRVLWFTQLGSMVGTWMQNVGAQWLLIHQPGAETLVALVQAAAMVPVLVLAMPAGALADIVDRRRLLIGIQVFQVMVGVALFWLTLAGRISPGTLLTFTFLLGCGTTVTIPGFQALVQDLVPRQQLRSVAALNGIAMNLARAIGPPVAGVIVALSGPAAVFALNTLSFAALAAVLLGLPSSGKHTPHLPERFGGALRAGARYVRHSAAVRRIVLRCLLFVVPGAALWALLPLVASRLLHLGAGGYGLLLAALGAGAIIGAAFLPRIGNQFTPNQLVLIAGLVFAAATVVTVTVRNVTIVMLVLVPAGLAWLSVLATLNGALQMFLPGWVRARGLSVYQMAFAGGQAVGSVIWGIVAQMSGLTAALLVAGILLVASALSVAVLPLYETGGLNRDPAVYWPQPHLEFDPELEGGPVLVTRSFRVPADRIDQFLQAWQGVRRSRLRTGATSCAIYRDGAVSGRLVEVSLYPTWAEHLRQHEGRLTGADREVEEAAQQLAEGVPRVEHLLPADSSLTSIAGPGPNEADGS